MSITAEYFEKNGYVILKNALPKETCDDLTRYMFDLFKQGKLTKDDQCPLSDAVYGDPIFDELLQKFADPIGLNVGRKLLPTYTYARIYRPGEVLKKHKDRPACEISATLTLGFDSKPIWPIFFDEEREVSVSLDQGEMAVYKGCDIVHWRPSFKGQWHVQVFLHYVDANGPYKDHVRDGRSEFGVQKTNPVKPANELNNKTITYSNPILDSVIIPSSDRSFPGYFCIDSKNLPGLMFTDVECEKILKYSKNNYPTSASVGGSSDNSRIKREIRSANIFNIDYAPETKWLFEKVATIVSVANTAHFDYLITGITHSLQLVEYQSDTDIQGHYNWHIDAGPGEPSCRKISLTAQLTDPREYEGCELLINNHTEEVVGTKERGSVHLFPGYMPHRVTPITRGTRYALVIWIHGPTRFK